MAKEWYLMKSPYDQLSGFEGEGLEDFGQEGLFEVLDSPYSEDIEICNYDLSVRKKTKGIILDKVQDTKLKTLSRMMLVPIGTCKAGLYVFYKNRYWLITGIVDDNKVYEKAILSICNYQLTWMDKHGKVHQRWAHIDSASQYNNGETNMINFFVRSDQLMAYIPNDDESLRLDTGVRFIVDIRCNLYEKTLPEDTVVNTDNALFVYKITRSDNVLYNYIDSGILGYMLTQTEQAEADGYYVIDGKGYWLCYSEQNSHDTSPQSCDILSDSDCIYIDLDPGLYTAVFYDENHQILTSDLPDYRLYVDAVFAEDLQVHDLDNSISVFTSDYGLNNKSFDVVLDAVGYPQIRKTFYIREFL